MKNIIIALLFCVTASANIGPFPGGSGGGGGGITSINGDSTAAQIISGSTPINASTAGGTTTITCDVASGAGAGCLSAANWTTFNGKQNAISFGTGVLSTLGNSINTAAGMCVLDNSSNLGIDGSGSHTVYTARNTVSDTAGNDITLQAGGATSAATNKNGGNAYVTSGISTGTGSSNIYFQTATAATATGTSDNTPTTKMTILGNGNIGIGTTAPANIMSVSTVNPLIKFFGTAGTAGTWFGEGTDNMLFAVNRNPLTAAIDDSTKSSWTLAGFSKVATASDYLRISHTPPGSSTNTVYVNIDTNGNMGIGNTSPQGKLDVTGSICLSGANCISAWPSALLNSWTSGAGTVASTDTVLQALQKIDGNVGTKQNTITFGTGTQAVLANAPNAASGFVQLDSSSKLPAVDGSQLTNLPSSSGPWTRASTTTQLANNGDTVKMQYDSTHYLTFNTDSSGNIAVDGGTAAAGATVKFGVGNTACSSGPCVGLGKGNVVPDQGVSIGMNNGTTHVKFGCVLVGNSNN